MKSFYSYIRKVILQHVLLFYNIGLVILNNKKLHVFAEQDNYRTKTHAGPKKAYFVLKY